MDISDFEKKNSLSFKDKGLLKQAFIHRSYINENRKLNLDHNERLEFLGDAVLELIVTDHLYKKYKDKTEGELTSYRSALVNANTLSTVAMNLGVNNYLMLSKGEAKDMGRARQYILADTMEAIIGAIFIDGGYDAAEKFISKNILAIEGEIIKDGVWIDAKSHLQERVQDVLGITPTYKTIKEEGPDHNKFFTVGVYFDEELAGVGEGESKQEAEQTAANVALMKKGWK